MIGAQRIVNIFNNIPKNKRDVVTINGKHNNVVNIFNNIPENEKKKIKNIVWIKVL